MVDVRLHVTTQTRSLVALSDGWKRVRLWLVEEETRERKYVIERVRDDRPYHHVAVEALAKSARDLEPISAPQDVATIERLLADNDAYGRAMYRMFDAVDANDFKRVKRIHDAIDPTFDRMEHTAVQAEGRYGHAEYLALEALERTQSNVTRAFPILALLALLALSACILIVREYRRRADALTGAQVAELEAAVRDDALTGLGNHRAFREALDTRIDAARPGSIHLALVDIDHFKKVNDRYGHVYGDGVLRSVGEVLRETTTARAFRVGGDEFALLFCGIDIAEASAQLERARAAGSQRLGNYTLSVGVASFDGLERDLTALHERADIALYEAKHRGRNNVVRFETALVVSSSSLYARRLALERVLARPTPLAMVFQPLFHIDGTLLGYEALARFGLDFSSPLDAFDVAERLDLTPELDRRCIESVAATLPSDFASTIFLNVSPTTLADETAALAIFDAFASATNLAPERVTIELTEQMRISENAIATIARLRERGFRIALDDTGSGNAGLAILATIPVDVVKIDGALMALAERDERAAAVASGIFAMAEHLHASVVMEGIETEAHIAYAHNLARRHGMLERLVLQGYALGRPGALPAVASERHRLLGNEAKVERRMAS